ncbi:hypothetical protein SUGI_0117130 [Cryptomeria japonica]|uniref:LEAF RUST 10 DISEASE-RESISTANCE LOCUS RECEPTOR-LIKE PROTEIN KINASE-like 2.4 n=1 Tax=Cryptomeria japonica TaxID=3369 RepID=UPI002408F060|nr:LEAF RUST 10 DISEASE-RESISTANCE LOCUS RECEPTOR-LIKE PROTEIN KINASE-like 2.4 [Cryptomeria japonica]GLJ09859.1 hypothetical protein SUGI_0117130 [Cryptomeria japonica]
MLPLSLQFSVILYAILFRLSLCVDPQYEYCKRNQTCGNTNFRFPFGVGNRSCGLLGFQIDCVDKIRPVIELGRQQYTILQIFNANQTFTMTNDKNFQHCEFINLIELSWDSGYRVFNVINIENASLLVYQCDEKCVLYGSYPEGYLNVSCFPRMVTLQVQTVQWTFASELEQKCRPCEKTRGFCGFNFTYSRDFFCFCQDGPQASQCPPGKAGKRAVIGVAIGTVSLLTIAALAGIFYRKSRTTSDVERFLHDHVDEMPRRYSYSQLKKITNNFTEKLGEGAFGVVYKGKLLSGTLVAVKILDQSRHSESQFMSEVATLGRIHHIHLVRLMGYCFEKPRSALMYEYMANGSLDKFIFAGKEKTQMLNWDRLYSIALGAARGIAYLHQDCNRCIIHFDIKPHNILLDDEFTPKVADFGLAKLCVKGQNHISITATRGTLGYVAPETWSRNMGPVTDKSDVYSFGIVLLEIVGGRNNLDVQLGRYSQFEFLQWAFKLIECGELEKRLKGVKTERGYEEEEKAVRLTKVGLWCIQHNSMNRPSMNRVVQMLEGNGDDVSNPPFPCDFFNSPEPPLVSQEESLVVGGVSEVV